MTQHDDLTSPDHDPAAPAGTPHGAADHDGTDRGELRDARPASTPLPRRRDVHRPDAGPRRTSATAGRARRGLRGRRAGVPVALTVMALSTGLATGVSAAAGSSSGDASAAPVPTDTPTTAEGASFVQSQVSTPDAAVSDAQAVLERATSVANDSAALSDEQREKIAKRAERLRGLVADQSTDQTAAQATAQASSGSASAASTITTAASRSADRESLDERKASAAAQGATATTPQEESAEEAPADATATGDNAANTAAAEGTAVDAVAVADEVAVGDAIVHTTLLADQDGALAAADAATGSGAGAGAVAAAPASGQKLAEATKSLTNLLDRSQQATVEIEPAPDVPDTPAEIMRAQVRAARSAASALAKYADDTEGYENGRLSTGDLNELSFAAGEQLRKDAAEQLERLDAAYRAQFGTHLEINDTYRSYESQVAVKASKGYLAAVPGYSNHGWGVAVDLGGGVDIFGTAQYEWLRENAPKFGWDNPGWARADGRKPEAWHWEYSPLT
ncbi:hypothetical protein GCM10009809_13060 [Isoptericola hypogeus]|uniref:D-alanyl-D-alanine carboxypeptidase-like core domain-containing protein n=1 Tax=Isoptericola hypogeus TaxID=300179 RepID=A0ABP4V6F8_9MICO